MGFVSKLNEAQDKNGNMYFWGYLNIAMFSIKITIFKSKKEDESTKWNMFWEQQIKEEDKKVIDPR